MTTIHHAVLALSWTILGMCVGSFLNVCIHRIPRGMSLLRPRSRCPACGASIRAWHNIPVLGWLVLRGRCRSCGGPISWRYPAVELAVGLLFAAPYLLAWAIYGPDPWERIGAGHLLVLLVGWWTAAGVAVLASGAGVGALCPVKATRAGERHRAAGGCEARPSSALRS